MSYDVQLYRIETKVREQKSGDESFFENEHNLEPFSPQQMQELTERLEQYNYRLTNEDKDGKHFEHEDDHGISVLLTNRAVYFQTSGGEDGIFEIGMTSSEFTDTDEYAKYDPQNDGWEEQ